MPYPQHKQPALCSLNDWKAGVHEDWEVAAHEEAKRRLELTGKPWSYDERAKFIDKYLSTHSFDERNRPRRCQVCTDVIAEAMLQGVDPWKMNDDIRRMLREAGASFHPGRKRLASRGLTHV